MRTRRIAGTSLLAAGLMLGTSGCGLAYLVAGARQNAIGNSGSGCSAWASAMASPAPGDTKNAPAGEATPLAAVTKAATEYNEPPDGWSPIDAAAPDGQTFASGPYTIHVQKLPDGTWFADKGSSCSATFGSPSPMATATPVG